MEDMACNFFFSFEIIVENLCLERAAKFQKKNSKHLSKIENAVLVFIERAREREREFIESKKLLSAKYQTTWPSGGWKPQDNKYCIVFRMITIERFKKKGGVENNLTKPSRNFIGETK
jgi:hypothetical protein